jgi:large subunit ribosomal protein L9
MKIILLSDVKSLGRKGDVVDVAEGYARNYLLPRALAQEASKGALAVLGEQKKATAKREAQALAEAEELAKRIASTTLAIKAKAGQSGKLFGAITSADIASAINSAFAISIDKNKIELKTQIKALGSYPVQVKLYRNVVAQATVDVVSSE